MRKIASLLFFTLVFSLLFSAAAVDESAVASKLTRLHVIANSNSRADQELKLALRDELLCAAPSVFEDVCDRAELITRLTNEAESALMRLGSDYPVHVTLSRENYSTREYSSFSLPAGEYRSLRVIIGEGEGENWWCVLFPPLCFASCEEFIDTAEDAGLTNDEISLITADDGGYIVRFKLVELAEKLIRLLSANR